MKMKLFKVAEYLGQIFGKEPKKSSPNKKDSDETLKKFINRFFNEGFGFWLDPFESFRKSFVARAGPALSSSIRI